MSVPLLDLNQQHAPLMAEFRQVFEQMAASSRFILGPAVEGFETRLAAYCGVSHAVGMSSGTDALLAALMALGIGAGDEVITTPFTFFATAGCIARVGARPVFVDIEARSFNIDPQAAAAAITPRTRAIMPVHLYGQTADMQPLLDAARPRGIAVIEDAAQAIGAKEGSQLAGAMGDVGCLSFYPSKNLSAMGDAGACTTRSAELYAKLKMTRLHGEETRYHHSFVGGNFRIDAFQAGVLGVKLPHLNGWAQSRRDHARRYGELLEGLPLTLPRELPGKHHVFNQYTLRVAADRRAALREHLKARGIGHEVYYPLPLHLQKCFQYLGHKAGEFPVTERAAEEVLSLPVFPEMSQAQQDEVAQALREFFR